MSNLVEAARITLSTGREVDAYLGVVGIAEDGAVRGGFDDMIEGAQATCPDHLESDEWESWTTAEKMEFADLIIERWQAYKRRVAAQ